MNKTHARLALGTAAGLSLLIVGATGTANADPQVGACTNSYAPYTYDKLAFDPAAQAIFPVIDTNGNGVICFKAYPNGPHTGHDGNLVDDKAGPHS
jgi:hypothetical protein